MEPSEKIAILQAQARDENVPLPYPVARYLASAATADRWELEGLLIRLVAYASLTDTDITLPLACKVLGPMLREMDEMTPAPAVLDAWMKGGA